MKEICKQAALYAYDELTPSERAAFEQHLATCAACQREVAFIAQTQAALVPPAAPVHAVEHVLARTKPSVWRRMWKTALGGALAVCVGVWLLLAGPFQTAEVDADTSDWLSYVSADADTEYQNFVSDFEIFEAEF